MSDLTVYRFDPITRVYCGIDHATPDPLRPGEFLEPYCTVPVAPPATKIHEVAVLDVEGDKWAVSADWRGTTYWLPDGCQHTIDRIGETVPENALDAPPVSSEKNRKALLSNLANKRYEIETGGIVLPNGVFISTDREDQAIITGAVSAAQLGITEYDWKGPGGTWIKLKADEITQIGAAVAMHVQSCFTAERRHCEAIAALPDDQLDDYDINAGWPNGE